MQKLFHKIALLIVLLFQCGDMQSALAQTIEEERVYKLKAAFLLNFAKFTVWPESAFRQRDEFTLCILGEDPFGEAFAGVDQKRIGSRKVKVIRTHDSHVVQQCNLVFISHSENDEYKTVVKNLAGKPLLLVSDIEEFAENGGLIELTIVNNRLGFEINNSKAKEAGLSFKSSLLDLASNVY